MIPGRTMRRGRPWTSSDLTRELEALRDDALASDRGGRRRRHARGARDRHPRQEGSPDDRPARDRVAAARRPAARRRHRQRRPRRHRGRPRRARHGPARVGADRAPGAETVDVTTPGRRDPPRQPPPEHRVDGPDRRDLRPVRVRRLREPGDRGRPHQLPDAQHPARPSGARPVGHALRRRRGPPAADAHVARSDPRDAQHRSRRSARCCPAAASATRRSTRRTARSSSRSRA